MSFCRGIREYGGVVIVVGVGEYVEVGKERKLDGCEVMLCKEVLEKMFVKEIRRRG